MIGYERRTAALALIVFASVLGSEAAAQIPSCGTVTKEARIWQAGYQRYVYAYFETVAHQSGCFQEVQAEGWVNGVGGASTSRQPRYAWFRMGQSVPYYGRWQASGRHWVIHFGFMWESRGESSATVDMIMPATPGGGGGDGGGCHNPEYGGDPSRAGDGCESPLILDLAGDGYRLTSVRRGVSFDLDADGTPEQVAWTRPDSDDAWLALDRNGNGTIDDGSELFGNHTPAYGDKPEPVAEHGFVALKFAEGASYGPGRADGLIDRHDAVFDRLLLWTDRNHNGHSEPDELQKLSASHVAAISTEARESRRRDRFGNQFRLRAQSWWTDGSMHPVYDVWLLLRDESPETDEQP